MDVFLLFAIAVIVAAAVGVVAVVPFALPWPLRVRWTVIAQVTDQAAWGLTGHAPLNLRAVEVISVDDSERELRLTLAPPGLQARDGSSYRVPRPEPDVVAMLHEWCALRTPMLLYTDDSGIGSLTGPCATITDLRREQKRAADAR